MNENKTIHNQTSEIKKTQVYDALKQCYDPEIPINLVDLGLVYDVKINNDRVTVTMTLTTPGCGMGGYIANQVREKILGIPEIHEAEVKIVWEPKWNPSMMTEEARKKLGL